MAQQFGLHFSRTGIAATDNAPTTAPDFPPAAKYGVVPRIRDAVAAPPTLRVFAFDGTTITVEPWVYLADKDAWVQIGAGFAVTPSAPGSMSVAGYADARLFLRVTARTGVTAIGWRVGA